MSNREHYPEEFLPFAVRIRAAIIGTMEVELVCAQQEGMAPDVFLSGMLDTLLDTSARLACRMMFPQEATHSNEREERVYRVRRGLSHALQILMEPEGGEPGETNLPS